MYRQSLGQIFHKGGMFTHKLTANIHLTVLFDALWNIRTQWQQELSKPAKNMLKGILSITCFVKLLVPKEVSLMTSDIKYILKISSLFFKRNICLNYTSEMKICINKSNFSIPIKNHGCCCMSKKKYKWNNFKMTNIM